jgi:hypothetical protein
VNLFVIGFSREGALAREDAADALERVLDRLPFFKTGDVRAWCSPSGTAAAAAATHSLEQTGGVEYVRVRSDGFVLFAGRPIAWTGEATADGRAPLDTRFYLSKSHDWMNALDGRCMAARYDEGERRMTLFTDRLGAYPVFSTRAGQVRWFSNSAALLRELRVAGGLNLTALAGLMGAGWPLDGDPLWAGIERLEPGAVLDLEAGQPPVRLDELLELADPLECFGGRFEADRAAAQLVASVKALADWPGRKSTLPVTGGRDSRLVLAAALRAGLDVKGVTGGGVEADVEIARELCRRTGVEHELLGADPHGSVFSAPARAADTLALTAGGTASLADAAGFPLGPRPGPLELWHSGQGGEIARAYYRGAEATDAAGLVAGLYGAITARRPGRTDLLSKHGRWLLECQLEDWVERQLGVGVSLADVPDAFYLWKRMATWAAPTHGAVEYTRDTTSPLWSRRLLRHELGMPPADRHGELFHLRVLEQLAPDLVNVPFADGSPWRGGEPKSTGARRFRIRAGHALAAARRRMRLGSPDVDLAPDLFAAAQKETREAVMSKPEHDAWQVLHRDSVERLLGRNPRTLDTMSRYHVWRLATVFLTDAFD